VYAKISYKIHFFIALIVQELFDQSGLVLLSPRTSIDTGDYIDLIQSILVLILAPGSFYGIVQCMKLGLFSNVCCKPRKNQAKDKTNYNINKRIVKNQTLEINKVGHQI
jgi:hypothetical protein